MEASEHDFGKIVATMKQAVAALREADIPFLLAGSLAVWAQGGPERRSDLDFVVKEEDSERALAALEDAGMRPEHPPEEWLVKAWDGDVLVDLIHGPTGLKVDDALIARGKELHVLAITVRVMALEDALVSMLAAINEHSANYTGMIALARAVREQVDWDDVRRRTAGSPFARAAFTILEGLGVLAGEPARA